MKLKILLMAFAITFLTLLGEIMGLKIFNTANAQAKSQVVNDPKALAIMEKAFGGLGTKESYAMYFETIAIQVKKPLDVFSLPGYKVFKGGFLIINGSKYEMNLGVMKALCDGKVMVMTNEFIHTMVIDSIRTDGKNEETEKLLSKWMSDGVDDSQLMYEGLEKINGKSCHKIRAKLENVDHNQVIYWVAEDSGLLYTMAEKEQDSYNVYVIRSITEADKNHRFDIKALPKKTIEELKGYEVIDMRFARVVK